MEPKIVREFYLLSLNPKNGYYFTYGNEFGYGILGGILMDLYREGLITFQNKKLVVVNPAATNYSIFDRPLEIVNRKGSIRVATLLGRMGIHRLFYKKEAIRLFMVNNDLIQIKKKFLGIPYNRYYPKDRDFKLSIVRRMRDLLLRNEHPTNDELLLLILIHSCRSYRALSAYREERKRMRLNMKQLLKNGSDYTQHFDQIKELSAGIRKAIMAANASRTAAT